MLLRDEEGVHHLELAIKLYLGQPIAAALTWRTGSARAATTAWISNWRIWASTNCRLCQR